ncbi:Rad52/Rad22 family DNA repair protein [Stutzerimonas kunmingensis]|uniref:Rad52/Rad22 family DNA repair protein n=1 Tax=Stutzerimonas kunmingensis TaxID=1211807 RepID=UPI0028AF947E|nr:Rad52/Rad22 family DNA repair protein [Stutzerimonas kunmingensis]
MNNQNMSIWSQVEKTAPEATKSAKVNGQQITSISGQHMIKRATEVFGPVGIGWGWTVAEERFDQGGEIRNDKGELIGHEVGHTIRVKLWFMQGDKRGEVEQYGCTPFTYKSKWGVTTDTEAPKKSLTDAVKKALAMLGFSADIFLGLYDDRDYVAEREEEAALEQAENKEAEAARQKQERLDWLKSALDTMATAATLHELKSLHASYVRSATRRREEAFVTRLARAFEDRKAQLEQKDAA